MSMNTRMHILPFCLLLNHRIQDRQQLSHTSCQRHLLFFSSSQQPFIESFDHRIPFDGGQGSHLQHGADPSALTPNAPMSSVVPAIVSQGGHSNQGGHLLAVQSSQLGHFGQRYARQNGAHSFCALQQIILDLPRWVLLNQLKQLFLGSTQLLCQPREMRPYPFPKSGIGLLVKAIGFSCQHIDHLLPTRQHGAQLLRGSIRPRAGCEVHGGEVRQDLRILPICVGQNPRGMGKGSYLSQNDHRHRQLCRSQKTDQVYLQPACGFQDKQGGGRTEPLRAHLLDAGSVVRHTPGLPRGVDGQVQMCFRNINAFICVGRYHQASLVNRMSLRRPGLTNTGSSPPAIVRAQKKNDGTTCANLRSRGTRGYSICPVLKHEFGYSPQTFLKIQGWREIDRANTSVGLA